MEDLEKWKNIVRVEGIYQGSNLGRIRSLDRHIVDTKGVKRFYKGKILKLSLSKNQRYYHVGLYDKNRKGGTVLVHILIAELFVRKPKNAQCVLHLDNNRTNNHYRNLKWGTYSQNTIGAYSDNLMNLPFGWQRPKRRYDEGVYKKVYQLYNSGKYNKEQISRMVPVSGSAVIFRMVKTYLKHKDKIDKLLNL